VLSVFLSSCTPAPRYYAKKGKSQQVIEQTIGAAGDSTVRALRLAPPVKNFVRSRITSPFGARNNLRRSGREFHEGIDIKANRGEEIIAAAAGTVAFAGRQRGYGTVVIIDHGSGVSTVYAHLFYASVRKGEGVNAGQNIGRAGKRGAATGTHLHFEIRRGGKALDPMPHLWLDSMPRSPY
jgi:murein DD-endopeptidase MepM/ murein hydrolase activator NlpD